MRDVRRRHRCENEGVLADQLSRTTMSGSSDSDEFFDAEDDSFHRASR